MKNFFELFQMDETPPPPEALTRADPKDWRREPDGFMGTSGHAAFKHRRKFGLQVLVSHIPSNDSLHVSVSLPGKLPSWEDLKLVKNTFIGPDKMAFQVLPPRSEYVNLHPYCLHLWERVD